MGKYDDAINGAQRAMEAGDGGTVLRLAQEGLKMARDQSNPLREATALCLVGLGYDIEGDHKSAEENLRAAAALDEQGLGPGHPSVCRDRFNLGMCLYNQQRFAEAAAEFEIVVRDARVLTDRARALGPLATCYLSGDMYRQAESVHLQWSALMHKSFGGEDPRTLTALNGLGESRRRMGRPHDAVSAYQAVFKNVRGVGSPSDAQLEQIACAQHNLAVCLGSTQPVQAQELLQRAEETFEGLFGERHPYLVRTRYWMAMILRDRGEAQQAMTLLERAKSICEPQDAMMAQKIDEAIAAGVA